MNFAGSIVSKGGLEAGNGGVIRMISSIFNLKESATIDASSSLGNAGVWELTTSDLTLDKTFASFVSKTLNTSNVNLKTMKEICLALGGCSLSMSGNLNVLSDANIEKTSNISTQLSLSTEGAMIFEGQLNSFSVPLDVILLSSESVLLTSSAQLNARNIKLSAPKITVDGRLNAFGSNNSESPFLALLGGRLAISGRLQSGSKQNKGSIQIRGDNVVDINSANLVAANDDLGGDISIASNGDININNTTILTNGSNGRGGSLNIYATLVSVFNSTIKANGTAGGG